LADRITVLVGEDSRTVRRSIVEVLSAEPDMTVIGEAGDGKETIELCLARKPRVITLDMMMPVVSGLAATEYIMAFCPTPIVIVSGSTNRGEVFRTYEALAAGALDVIEKPRANEPIEDWQRRLVDTVRVASRVRVITHPRGRLRANWDFDTPVPVPSESTVPPPSPSQAVRARLAVVAIGASTGGPKAIVDVLRELPADFPVPILVVTHISESFAAGFADWVGANSPLPVRLAQDGDPVARTGVTVAPADRHLIVEDGRLRLVTTAAVHSCRPSIDVLFASLAREYGGRVTGVLLTGMGRDGADGLLGIRTAGGVTIAQDEDSCVIFGMPAEAIRLGAAAHVLAPAAIGSLLRELAPTEVW
jgi:two-component system chemotaxis response regulator CheB